MKKCELLPPPLFEMIAYCENKGYDIVPIQDGGKYRILIYKRNVLAKIGKDKFSSWKEGQRTAYTKLYTKIKPC